jgi:hypothetical protein
MALLYQGVLRVVFTDGSGQQRSAEFASVLQEDMPGLFSLGLPPHLAEALGARHVSIVLGDRTLAGPVGYLSPSALTFEVPA